MEKAKERCNLEVKYGCVFCQTGHEKTIAARIEQTMPHVKAYSVIQEKHKCVGGKRSVVREQVFNGYVFIATTRSIDLHRLNNLPGVKFVLTDHEGEWELVGNDREFVEWIFENDGIIKMSKVYKEGDKLFFQSGLLKDYEGNIIKINKYRGTAQVEFIFGRMAFKVWAAFEWI